MKKKRKLKKKFIVFFSLYFALFTSFFIYKSFSKYSTNINKTANVAVAKWDVAVTSSQNATFTIQPAGEQSYVINVTNDSDVGVTYSIDVSNIPKNSIVILDDEQFSNCLPNVSFTGGDIDPNDETTHTLRFVSPPDVDVDASNGSTKSVNINVTFTQKQPS